MAVILNWTNNDPYITTTEIRRSTDELTWTLIATVGPSVTTFIDNDPLPLGQLYFYRINSISTEICPPGPAVSDDLIQAIFLPDPSGLKSTFDTLSFVSYDSIVSGNGPRNIVSNFKELNLTSYVSAIRSAIISNFVQLTTTSFTSRVGSPIISNFESKALTSFDSIVETPINVVSNFIELTTETYVGDITFATSVNSDFATQTFQTFNTIIFGNRNIVSTFENITTTVFESQAKLSTNVKSNGGIFILDSFDSDIVANNILNLESDFSEITLTTYDSVVT